MPSLFAFYTLIPGGVAIPGWQIEMFHWHQDSTVDCSPES